MTANWCTGTHGANWLNETSLTATAWGARVGLWTLDSHVKHYSDWCHKPQSREVLIHISSRSECASNGYRGNQITNVRSRSYNWKMLFWLPVNIVSTVYASDEMFLWMIFLDVMLCCNWWNRGRDRRDGYREFDRGRRDKFSPIRHEGSPPHMKRMRRDW